ncbi:MAG: response regulator [Deltaproteobacteria bacterium]|nr:response regulator [Deltaproteobacteria bacterium]
MTRSSVLVVDDNCDMANGIAMLLGEAELETQVAYSAECALDLMQAREFELVLSDIRMFNMSGLDLLKNIRSRWPLTKVVLLTAYGTIDSAIDAMKSGACDYLTKPFDNDTLVEVVQRAIAYGVASGGLATAAVVGDVAAATSADDLLPGLRNAMGVLLEATGADNGEIFLCEPEGQDPLLSVWAGPDGDAISCRTRFAMGVGYPGIVVATGKPLCTKGGLAHDSRYLRRPVVEAGIRSLVAVPLPDARGALGSIHLMSRRDDFPVERVLDLLERVAVPVSNSVRAGLGALRQLVDGVSSSLDDATGESLRVLLESMRRIAGARYGTLALVDSRTGCPDRVVSTGPASMVCGHAEAGSWTKCPSVFAAHGFIAEPGRRQWPEPCRRGLPRRAASPCCLPLVADGRIYGMVALDFGREGTDHATGLLVPLLTMAHQVAIRLKAHREGLAVEKGHEGGAAGVTARKAPELELRCLGPFEAYQRGQPISAESFTRSKALVLLKLLALKAGAPVNREVLIECLWPDVEPQVGANRLHGVVHDLRSVIEPHRTEREWRYVRNRGDLYYLDVAAPIELDLTRFRLLLAQGLRAGAEHEADAIASLEQAVLLYRGDLFEDDPFAEWCEAERAELKECHVNALERLAKLHANQGSKEKALNWIRRASRSSPYRDDLILAEMELLAELSRPNEALAVYDDYVRSLADSLGVSPSEDVQAFQRRLLGLT